MRDTDGWLEAIWWRYCVGRIRVQCLSLVRHPYDIVFALFSRSHFVTVDVVTTTSYQCHVLLTVKLVAFLKSTLAYNEKKRADISDILRNPYLQSYYQRYKADFERMLSPKSQKQESQREDTDDK